MWERECEYICCVSVCEWIDDKKLQTISEGLCSSTVVVEEFNDNGVQRCMTAPHRHTLTQSISLSGPVTPSQAPVASCDRLTAENRRASLSAAVPLVMWYNPHVCLCVHLFAEVPFAWWFKTIAISNSSDANLYDRFDILCECQSLWFYKKKMLVPHCTLIFKHKPRRCYFGNNDILCKQSFDMQFAEKHLIEAVLEVGKNRCRYSAFKWNITLNALYKLV